VILEWEAAGHTGEPHSGELHAGELLRLPLAPDDRAEAELRPRRGIDVGEGKGRAWRGPVAGGAAGLILDGRGRPLRLPEDDGQRVRAMRAWMEALGAMPGSGGAH